MKVELWWGNLPFARRQLMWTDERFTSQIHANKIKLPHAKIFNRCMIDSPCVYRIFNVSFHNYLMDGPSTYRLLLFTFWLWKQKVPFCIHKMETRTIISSSHFCFPVRGVDGETEVKKTSAPAVAYFSILNVAIIWKISKGNHYTLAF